MFFTKMQGAGNDYILVLPEDGNIPDRSRTARMISDRRFGVGSDGLVFIDWCGDADFAMDFYNSDGSHAEICGNALRLIASLTAKKGLLHGTLMTVRTAVGIRTVDVSDADNPTVCMGKAEVGYLNRPIESDGRRFDVNYISMGNPHAVIFCGGDEDINSAVLRYGAKLENHPAFANGANVEFARPASDGFEVRVWERGAGQTLSCGSGACAVFAAAEANSLCKGSAVIHMKGGPLTVNSYGGELYLTGPATEVFTGNYKI